MARTTIKIDSEAGEMHRARKKYYGLSWEEYMAAGCPEIPEYDRD